MGTLLRVFTAFSGYDSQCMALDCPRRYLLAVIHRQQ